MTTLPIGSSTPMPFPMPGRATSRPLGVSVHAIGTLRVQRGRVQIHALGGPKAGANQALGLFAFLFDRADRGVDKDEAVELIWPDVSLTVADTAFHRTMLGIRGSLRTGGLGDAVDYRGGRYVLSPGLISWSDVAELEQLLEESASTLDASRRIKLLEACRQLNRADYMDDCPFFGTSVYVEPRRALCRAVREAVLVELADVYEAAGHRALAALRRAEAAAVQAEGAAPGTGLVASIGPQAKVT